MAAARASRYTSSMKTPSAAALLLLAAALCGCQTDNADVGLDGPLEQNNAGDLAPEPGPTPMPVRDRPTAVPLG